MPNIRRWTALIQPSVQTEIESLCLVAGFAWSWVMWAIYFVSFYHVQHIEVTHFYIMSNTLRWHTVTMWISRHLCWHHLLPFWCTLWRVKNLGAAAAMACHVHHHDRASDRHTILGARCEAVFGFWLVLKKKPKSETWRFRPSHCNSIECIYEYT